MGIQFDGVNNKISSGSQIDFPGSVGVAGTLTYEDVANIDAVGLITARTGIKIGPTAGVAGTFFADGSYVTAGIITATTFIGNLTGDPTGSGANLTSLAANQLSSGTIPDARFPSTLPAASGANLTDLNGSNIASGTVAAARIGNLDASKITSGTVATARLGSGTANNTTFLRGDSTFATPTTTTINNNANNRVITGSGTANTLEGEANLVWDGSAMGVGLNNPNDTLHVYHATDNLVARFESGDTGGGITLKDNTHVTSLLTTNGAFEINVDQGGDITGETIAFKLSGSEKLKIDSSGRVHIGGVTGPNSAKLFVSGTNSNSYVTLRNTSASDGSGARWNSIRFQGTQSGGEVSDLVHLQANHDGTSDDEKGSFQILVNDGNDGDSLQERLRIKSDGSILIGNTNGGSEVINMVGGGGGILISRSASGSPNDGQTLGDIGLNSYSSSQTCSSADVLIRGQADGAHSGSSAGSALLVFTKPASTGPGSAPTERLRINKSGAIGIAGANYGSSGQVLTSQGSGSAVQWATPSSGVNMVDEWRLSTSLTNGGSEAYITSNWVRNEDTNWGGGWPFGGSIGSAMSQSSGYFSFPSTGIYKVEFNMNYSINDADTKFIECNIIATRNNSSYTIFARSYGPPIHSDAHNEPMYGSAYTAGIMDVTNTSNCKFRLNYSCQTSSNTIIGGSYNATHVTVTRLGNT